MFVFVSGLFVTLIVTPVVGFIFVTYLVPKYKLLTPICFIGTMFMLGTIFASSRFRFSFIGANADLIYIFTTCFMLGVCVFLSFRLTPWFVFRPLAILLAVPFIALPLLSFLGGGLAIYFAAADFEIDYQVQSDSGFVCRVVGSGNATTSTNWYTIGVYKPGKIFESELETFSVDQLKNRSATPENLCDRALSMYEGVN